MENQISGIIFHPCFMSEEDFENGMKSTDYYTSENFLQVYRNHIAANEIVASCAKIYILKNYEKIESWKGLDVKILDNSGKITEYYNYDETPRRPAGKRSDTIDGILKRIDKDNKAKHNPINTLTDVVLDTTDTDFSLKINGKDHLWIDDESCILIANFIENKINGKG